MAKLQDGTGTVRIEGVKTPTGDNDAANKQYVDNITLDDISDVSISDSADGKFLKYDDEDGWQDSSIFLNSLAQVSITSQSENDVLRFNGTTWVNEELDSEKFIAINSDGTGASVHSSDNDAIAIGEDARVDSGGAGTDDADGAIAIGKDALVGEDKDNSARHVSSAGSVALGRDANVLGLGSVAIGDGALVDGSYAIAIGEQAQATEDDNIAVGDGARSSGDNGIAIGNAAVAGKQDATEDDQADVTTPLAIGNNAKAYHSSGVALGNGAVTTKDNHFVLGKDTHLVELARQTTDDDDDLAVATKKFVLDNVADPADPSVESIVIQQQDVELYNVVSSIDNSSDTRQIVSTSGDGITSLSIRHQSTDGIEAGTFLTFYSEVANDPNAYAGVFEITGATQVTDDDLLDGWVTFTYTGKLVDNIYEGDLDGFRFGASGQTVNIAVGVERGAVTQFRGADGTDAGFGGLVPQPASSDNNKVLKGDGTWSDVDTAQIADGAVDTDQLADDSVTYDKVDITGTAGQVLAVNADADGWEFTDAPSDVNEFIDVDQTDTDYGNPNATGESAIAIGNDADAAAENSIAIGTDVDVHAKYARAISIGTSHSSQDRDAVDTINIGSFSRVDEDEGIAIGRTATSQGERSIAIGARSDAEEDDAVILGHDSMVQATGGVTIGNENLVRGVDGFAAGKRAIAQGDNAIVIGDQARGIDANTIVLGGDTTAYSDGAISVGDGANSSGQSSIALGDNAKTGTNAIVAFTGLVENSNTSITLNGLTIDGSEPSATNSVTLPAGMLVAMRHLTTPPTFDTFIVDTATTITSSSATITIIEEQTPFSTAAGSIISGLYSGSDNSIAIGQDTSVAHEEAIAIGYQATTDKDYDLRLGGVRQHPTVHESLAGHESAGNQLATVEYVNIRTGTIHEVVDAAHPNAIGNSTGSTFSPEWNFSHADETFTTTGGSDGDYNRYEILNNDEGITLNNPSGLTFLTFTDTAGADNEGRIVFDGSDAYDNSSIQMTNEGMFKVVASRNSNAAPDYHASLAVEVRIAGDHERIIGKSNVVTFNMNGDDLTQTHDVTIKSVDSGIDVAFNKGDYIKIVLVEHLHADLTVDADEDIDLNFDGSFSGNDDAHIDFTINAHAHSASLQIDSDQDLIYTDADDNDIVLIDHSVSSEYINPGAIGDDTVAEVKLNISNAPSDGAYLTYKDSTDELTWVSEIDGMDITDNTITESRLNITNTPTNAQFLSYNDGMVWADIPDEFAASDYVKVNSDGTAADAAGDNSIAIGENARTRESYDLTFNITSVAVSGTDATSIGISGLTINGSAASSDNSLTLPDGSTVTFTQGGVDVDGTIAGPIPLTGSTATLIVTENISSNLSNGAATAFYNAGNHSGSIVIGKDGESTQNDQLVFAGVSSVRTPDFTGGTDQFIAIDANGDWSTSTVAAGVTIQDEGSSLSTAATTLNFTGGGVTASGTGATKTINIASASDAFPEFSATSDYSDGDGVRYGSQIFYANKDVDGAVTWVDADYDVGTWVVYNSKYYLALLDIEEGDDNPEDNADWSESDLIFPGGQNTDWDAFSREFGGTDLLMVDVRGESAAAHAIDGIALGSGAISGLSRTVTWTSVDTSVAQFFNLVTLSSVQIDGAAASSSNSLTIPAGTALTITQGSNTFNVTTSTAATVLDSSSESITFVDASAWGTGSGSFTYGAGENGIAIGTDAQAEHNDAVAIGHDAATTKDYQIMLGAYHNQASVGFAGYTDIIELSNSNNVNNGVWINSGFRHIGNFKHHNTPASQSDDTEWAYHNFAQFKRLMSGNVTGSDAMYSYYKTTQSSLGGYKAGALSRIVLPVSWNGVGSDAPDGWVAKVFYYNSDGKLGKSALIWVDHAGDEDDRDAIFGSGGDTDSWTADPSDPSNNGRHTASEGAHAQFLIEGQWTGFDTDNSNVDMSSTGNVLLLGVQYFQYTDGKLTINRIYPRRESVV